MPRVTLNQLSGNARDLNTALLNNSEELSFLQESREQFEEALIRMQGAGDRQAALTAAKQTATEELQALMAEVSRRAAALRSAVKAIFGHRSQRLPEFGIQPLKGRRVVRVPEPEPQPEPEPETPPIIE